MKRLVTLSLAFTAALSSFSTPVLAQRSRGGTKKPVEQPAAGVPTQLPSKKPAPTEAAPSVETTRPVSKQPSITTSNALRVNYGYASWNKSATRIDSASMLMREGASGKIVQIHLVETAPDSSVFSGLYSISFQDMERLNVEFYVPPQELLETPAGIKKLSAMIAGNQLRRNPYILRRSPNGTQSIEIFDTREQAQAAMKAYLAEQQIQGLQNRKYPSDQEVATARLAEELKQKEAVAQAASERVRLEQLEAKRLAELKAQQAALAAAESERRKKEAAVLSSEALALFQQEKFKEAAEKFDRAVELDPENQSYYFQHGVTLYKLENFNRSIALLNLAEGPQVNPIERDYFLALNHFRLKDYPSSLAAFEKVHATKHPDMGPSALFYKGVIHFESREWEKAKNAFQEVLDTSKDPRLDNRAEAYLEQILRLQQFEAEKARKWQLSATLGELYDTNVLLIADSTRDAGVATNTEGYRTLFAGSARYRPVYEETRELALQLDVLTMYTLDKSFKGDQTLRNADPLVATFMVPYTYKGLAFGKGYKLDLSPGYESIWMSVENNENKEIIGSGLLNMSNLFVMSDSLFSNFNVELRYDKSKLDSSTGDNDATAVKTKLINSNLHFLTDDKTKLATTEIGFTLNNALGKNAAYNRLDLGIGYIQPWFWETTATLKLSYFNLSYPQRTDNRLDNSYTLTTAASKKLNDVLSTGLTASYNINNSNNESNTYKKWTVMLTLSALYGF